jgi:hypothetical protein
LEGDLTGNVEGNDQPSQPEQICACGHGLSNHSYDPEGFEGNLACDICGCTNFRKQSFVEGPKQDYGAVLR